MKKLTVILTLVMVVGIAFGSKTNNTKSVSGTNSDEKRKAILDKTVAQWKECLEYHEKHQLLLTKEEVSEFKFPEVGGALFEHSDFISYIELIDSDDPTKQMYRIYSYCKVHNREEESDDGQVFLEVMIQQQNKDGSTFEEMRTIGNGWHPSMMVFQNAHVEWLGNNRISYSPSLVKVSESSEAEYENIVNTIKSANR